MVTHLLQKGCFMYSNQTLSVLSSLFMDKYSYIANASGDYINELYRAFQENPASVEESWQKFFEGFEFYQTYYGSSPSNGSQSNGHAPIASPQVSTDAAQIKKEMEVVHLIRAYRSRGHLAANTNPIRPRKDRKPLLSLSDYGFTEADLDTVFVAGSEVLGRPSTLREVLEALQKIYTGSIGFEYLYIREREVKNWLRHKIEKEYLNFEPTLDEKKHLLDKLNEAVVFENFLHTKYVGQKRFSLEGGENTIPALDTIINRAAELGVKEAVIGMAHRGRLNVLCNILGKTYETIFSEFEGNYSVDLSFGDGDVKYHVGFSSQVQTPSGNEIHLELAPNPSHLEAVNPVVEGFIRAKGDGIYNSDFDKVLPILIHGDAALAGQGIVYEVTQMANLAGYYTGGTIHFVINNQVGFTTDFEDARSSIYCTDVAKIIDAPVLHVNGDDAEAVMFCARLAAEFRQEFNRDIFIDMVCYRRHGHNESDEPRFTQPKLYALIANHPSPREVYVDQLVKEGDLQRDMVQQMDTQFRAQLQDRLDMVRQTPLPYAYQKLDQAWSELRKANPEDFEKSPDTFISQELIDKIGKALATVPEGFKPLKQIEKLLKDRQEMFFDKKVLNWAAAELLAYGSLLSEGKMVRLSGQDVERGTFSHRHAVLTDAETNETYLNLDHISEDQQSFRIYNSLLSEYGVLGFEFGYSMANPNALVIWEAQFGDFANGAQVMIDQFIAASESKWNRMNGVTLLLPHGYEGQGPEHSSARLERFLQLAAEFNIVVANVTQPANFFHLLRRQLAWPFRKPLVVMSPKSMLRHPMAMSPMEEFTSGGFKEIVIDSFSKPKQVKRILLCTGKIFYELQEEQQKQNRDDVVIVRIEQLHPFPIKQLYGALSKYDRKSKAYWVQEEPENMGAWSFITRTYNYTPLELIARKSSASPATGYAKIHAKEQAEIIRKAFA
jgi:2-oxoglutarate dehydrogenase E1 component